MIDLQRPRDLRVVLPSHVGECIQALPALQRLQRNGHRLALLVDACLFDLFHAYAWTKAKHDDTEVLVLSRYALSQFVALSSQRAALDDWRAHHSLLSFFWSLADECCAPEIAPVASTLMVDCDSDTASIAGDYVVIVPFASCLIGAHSRCWPHYAALSRALCNAGQRVVVCPAPHEISQSRGFGAEIVPGLNLREYASVIRRAQCVIANDTGPAHLSAALGVPTIILCGPADTSFWSPKNSNAIILKNEQWATVLDVLNIYRNLSLSA